MPQGLGQLRSFPVLEVGADRGCAVGFPSPVGTFLFLILSRRVVAESLNYSVGAWHDKRAR